MHLESTALHPFVRYVRMQSILRYPKPLVAKDARVFCCTSGHGAIAVNGRDYLMRTGSFLLWQADMVYCYQTDANAPMELVGCNFDFTTSAETEQGLLIPTPPVKNRTALSEKVTFGRAFPMDGVLYLYSAPGLLEEMLRLCREWEEGKRYAQEICSLSLARILWMAQRRWEIGEEGESHWVDDVLDYLRLHATENLTNADIGKQFGYHPNYINRVLLRHTGLSLHAYLVRIRLEHAVRLLQSTDLTVGEIATVCGFSDAAHFSKTFRRQYGASPGQSRF